MACPYCQLAGVPPGAVCPRCRRRSAPSDTAAGQTAAGWRPLILALFLAALVGVYTFRDRLAGESAPAPSGPSATDRSQTPLPAPTAVAGGPSVAATPLPPPAYSGPQPRASEGDLPAADDRRLMEIGIRLQAGRSRLPEDLDQALDILDKHPAVSGLPEMVENLAMLRVRDLAQKRQTDEAIRVATEAVRRRPTSAAPRLAVLEVYLQVGRWQEAEAAARQALQLEPASNQAREGLGLALFRLNRDREAAEVLEKAAAQGSQVAAQLLGHIKKENNDEQGMRETEWAHFSVRFDGDVHDGIAREVLSALDHHYADLTLVFQHESRAPIPVILFGRADYQRATDAPAWSGGVYSHLDGRIRIPLRPGQTSVDPGLDRTLMHELTHAFVAEMSAGHAPRDLHEGLAQYMEGLRSESLLDDRQLTALAEGRVGGVQGFYLDALVFVEFLMDERGQGGINDLLGALATEGGVDAAYERVYGRSSERLHADAQRRLDQRHGR